MPNMFGGDQHDPEYDPRGSEPVTDQEKLDQLSKELISLEAERIRLRDEKNELDDRLKEIEDRLRALCGGYHKNGEIGQKKAEIKRLAREIADKKKPRVIWTDGTTSDNQIVDRVTPKRIFVRQIGWERSDQYVRTTGERVGGWSSAKVIDLKAMGITPSD